MPIEMIIPDQALYQKFSRLVNSFVDAHKLSIQGFLEHALDSAFELIPEAEKGSLYIASGNHFIPVCAKGYDLDLLKKLSFTKDDLFIGFECTDIDTIESYENYILKRDETKFSSEIIEVFKAIGTYEKFTSLFAPLQYEDMLIGLISLERFDDKHFSDQSKEILRFYAQSISNHYALKISQEKERKIYNETIMALATAIEVKDAYTEGHARRVMEYSTLIAKAMHLPEDDIEHIRTAALLHDVGKIGISNTILDKPSKLTPDEYDIVKKHPENAKKILSNISNFSEIMNLAYMHHEHYDGAGYPQGLAGEDIPLGAHIIQLADAYDAMTTQRAYREAMPTHVAFDILIEESGHQFHPKVVEIALRVLR